MLLLSIRDIFEIIDSRQQIQFTIKLSCFEVFNETIRDLLGNNQQTVRLFY